MSTLTILRHGKSIWNTEKRFTGWADIALSPRGVAEARHAGQMFKKRGLTFDVCFTSYLSRATETLRIVLDTMKLSHVEVQRDWRLNERHYGALQGLDWWQATRKYGAQQLLTWQREFDVPPPPLDSNDPRFPGHDPLYAHLSQETLPCGESLKDTLARLLPFWHDVAVPKLHQGSHILIVAHHNSLRCLKKHIEQIDDTAIARVKIRTADAIMYEIDEQMRLIRSEKICQPSRLDTFMQQLRRYWTRTG